MPQCKSSRWWLVIAATTTTTVLGCEREERRFEEIPALVAYQTDVGASPDRVGGALGKPPKDSPFDDNAWAISQGERYYEWFNCVGCHAHGGGGMGPPLMDPRWIYGSEPANLFTTIMDGRPNGMPSFRGRITPQQAWQIVAYVRSMSGLVPMIAAPGRPEGLAAKPPESMQDRLAPTTTGPQK